MTKKVQIHKKDWSNILTEAAWAYRTTWKATTGFTSFELVYGKAVMMPIEFEHKTLQTTLELNITLLAAQDERILHLKSLYEMRKIALQRIEIIQQQ